MDGPVSLTALSLLAAVGLAAPETACNVEETIAYSRDTTPGIPPGEGVAASPDKPLLTTYFIYLVVAKGTVPSVSGVWLKAKHYAVTLRKVTPPVMVEHDPAVPTGEKDTLVPATSSDVYQLLPGDERPWSPKGDDERQLTRANELVVFLRDGGSVRYCTVRSIKRLRPAAGM
jgi:hypothetical protein